MPSNPIGPTRLGIGPASLAVQLGPLASLQGNWRGTGFNAIWRPDNTLSPQSVGIKRFLELNLTNEQINFQAIQGVVPNRGFDTQEDLSLFGLHYLQQVSDADLPPFSTAGQALHIEPGFFMNVPASIVPDAEASIVRLASIPHGVTVQMSGPTPSTTPTPGRPAIPPVDPFANFPGLQPFTDPVLALGIQPITNAGAEHVVPEVNIAQDVAYPGSQSNGPFPPDFQGFISDPNSVLRNAIAGQNILGNITINLSSSGDQITNIPFLGTSNPAQPDNPTLPNAFVYSASATFWIEWVGLADETPPLPPQGGPGLPDPIAKIEPFWDQASFVQLQYSQLVILIFNDILWPHVTVATLTLNAG